MRFRIRDLFEPTVRDGKIRNRDKHLGSTKLVSTIWYTLIMRLGRLAMVPSFFLSCSLVFGFEE
jgi:hypothetical protein